MNDRPDEMHALPTGGHGHEETDAQIRPLVIFLAGLAGSLIVVAGLVWMFFGVLLARVNNEFAPRQAVPLTADQASQPRLQISPRQDLELLRQQEETRLHAIEWIDRDRGIARVPVETAIEIVARQGLPTWPAVNPSTDSRTKQP